MKMKNRSSYDIKLIKTDPFEGWYFYVDIEDRVFMESELYASADQAMWEFYWNRVKWETKTMTDNFKKRRNKMEGISMTEYRHPNFTVNQYDSDGDCIETGIYLHYGEMSIKVAETLDGFKAHAEHLASMADEISELI